MKKILFAMSIAGVMLAACQPLSAPVPTTVPTSPRVAVPAAAPTPSSIVLDLLDRINKLRADNGLGPYKLNDQLTVAALRHSQDMANTFNISHTGSDGSTATQRIRKAGYTGGMVGEIIYGGQVSEDDAWKYWTQDPSHQAALLDKQYTEAGIGVATSANGIFFTVDFGGP